MSPTNQVLEVPLETRRHDASSSYHKRARLSSGEHSTSRGSSSCSSINGTRGSSYGGGGGENTAADDEFLPTRRRSLAWPTTRGGPGNTLPPVEELPNDSHAGGGTAAIKQAAEEAARGYTHGDRDRGRSPRSASPTPSCASSALSAATTTATSLSSRASLSSCRSSLTLTPSSYSSSSSSSSTSRSSYSSYSSSYGSNRRRYSAGSAGAGAGGSDFFPKPSSSWGRTGMTRRRRGSSPVDGDRRDRDRYSSSSRSSRDHRHYGCPPPSRRGGGGGGGGSVHKDYASEAGSSVSRKRNRSRSRERRSASGGSSGSAGCSSRRSSSSSAAAREGSSGVECARCLEWCRQGRTQRKPITRTLQMDYYVRTPSCKAAKSKHIDFIDDVAYSREQFIEETVFTCPFTGVRRDTVLERNMFPYDTPTDVEHWTLWSREDLSAAELEAFVEAWAAENHPHAVEWECDNNEGERSIDWFHVHVFFRVGCEDRTGVARDPDSAYDGPYQRKEPEMETEPGEEAVAAGDEAAGDVEATGKPVHPGADADADADAAAAAVDSSDGGDGDVRMSGDEDCGPRGGDGEESSPAAVKDHE